MFANLRRAFREAVENMQRELDAGATPDSVRRLIRSMEGEAARTKASLEALKKDLEITRERVRGEEESAETCRRREAMAREIGDEETAALASKYAASHRERARVLADKAGAIEAEAKLLDGEYGEMLDQIRRAHTRASTLSATAGRTRARKSVAGADDLFARMDGMAAEVDGNERRGEAAELLFDDAGSVVDERAVREAEADARLAELKRRMGMR